MAEGITRDYLEKLKERRVRAKPVSRGYQLTGLMIANLLHDRAHKHLYLKLAREYDASALLALAKEVASRKGVANYGAYFMRRFQQTKGMIRRVGVPRRQQMKLPLRTRRA